MTLYLRYYMILVLALVSGLGLLYGGRGLWLPLAITIGTLVGGDSLLGDYFDHPEYRRPRLLEVPLFLALPVLMLLFFALALALGPSGTDLFGVGHRIGAVTGYDFFAGRALTTTADLIGTIFGMGFLVTGMAINTGHELTHQIHSKPHMLCGRWLLSMAAIPEFAIEHVYGHHAHLGTDRDPATARRGDNVYGFFLRSTIGGHLSAWRIETARLRRLGKGRLTADNRMLRGYLMTAVWPVLFFLAAGLQGALVWAGIALFSRFVLEVVNYMEHYGLVRDPGRPVAPWHSWNSNAAMSDMILFSLTRHSAHHEKGTTRYWDLQAYRDMPTLPFGYLTTIFICLVPPLWWRVMHPRLDAWEERYHPAAAGARLSPDPA